MLTKLVQGASLYTVLATFLVVYVCYVLASRKRKVKKEMDIHVLNKRILEYQPEPLINSKIAESLKNKILEITVPDETDPNCLNLAKVNFLDFLNNDFIKKKAEECIRSYGVGSCGPRGFYGTIDIHLDIESRIADFMGMEETVLYSYGFSTISSAVGAYCKMSDIVFCDEHISFATKQGLIAAKSTVVYFKHNDFADLEIKLKSYEEKEKQRNKLFRKFLIVEAIYGKTGTICPLVELLDLRKKYKLRIFLDETLSFGVLGQTGRGITEHLGVDRSEIDMIMGSLEGSLGSIGGFCVGASVIIEHQRLSGLGYCFSASLPPFLSYITICAIDLFEKDPKIFESLRLLSISMDKRLRGIPNLEVLSDALSPMKVIKSKTGKSLLDIHEYCTKQNMHLLKDDDRLLFNLNVNLSQEQQDRIIDVLSEAS